MSDRIRIARDEDVVRITIDAEEDGNRLTLPMIESIRAAVSGSTGAKLVLLRATGTDFCLGRKPEGGPPPKTALEIGNRLARPILDLYEAIRNAPAITIAAVRGRATGLGCALAASCDITIAASDASFCLPELEKNLPPTLAISTMMRLMPAKTLAWLIYSMRSFDADEAQRLGVVSEVVAPQLLDGTIDTLIENLGERPRETLTAIKTYLQHAPEMAAPSASEYAAGLLSAVMSSRPL